MNNFTIIGRVLGTPELETTASGAKIAHVILEVEKEAKGKDDLQTEIFKVTCFRNLAEIAKELTFGSRVVISGVLSANNYYKNGVTYYTPQLLANKILNI